ncbi:hypothetical protein NBRC110019_21260 [Neptunitalea chrysea]|uniref:DUF4178 domain-containing protein n=1 Tax=Neptunitalea chrysea TaxID=1647581 RepID=A0A9W6B5C0_9FLAO|nr:DUF4178 domain-containing protein [Neptunitalea chrysea]GLB53086.1 hypothetical protein NBRC110019_21260 [Neptunitalea chrysea]
MGFFDKFFSKKEEPHYDSTNITVRDLDINFVFDYDLSTWKVIALYEYDWGDSYFTREFKITDGDETLYLGMEEDDELELTIGSKIKLRELGTVLVNELMTHQSPPNAFAFKGENYVLMEQAPGYFHDVSKGENDWEEFISWDFENEKGTHVITIEQWGEKEFEASLSMYIEEYQLDNILPASEATN